MIQARQEGLVRGGQFVAQSGSSSQIGLPSVPSFCYLRSGCTSLVIPAFDTE
jgi:hypothetical protein